MARILIHVQYLKGLGHLRRVRLIAEAAAGQGLDVHIASGGLPVPGPAPARGVTLHQLPALQAGPAGFTDLRDKAGGAVNEAWLADRCDRLVALFADLAPQVLLIEGYPFARRRFAFELDPLLAAAHGRKPRPAVLCSIRDILQAGWKRGRAEEAVAALRAHFDAVLVHGDPEFARLDETFPLATDIAGLLTYTGLTAAPQADFTPGARTPKGEVLVSAGAGAIGARLMRAAIAARPKTALADAPWRLLAGPHMSDADLGSVRSGAGDGTTVERFRADFRRLLAAARVSVSYAGYNTCADLLRANVPAVLVPFAGGGETEQAARAKKLAALGRAVVLDEENLGGDALAQAVAGALALAPLQTTTLDLDGARKSAAALARWAGAHARG